MERLFEGRVRAQVCSVLSALVGIAILHFSSPALACGGTRPPVSFCGDAGCATVVCNTPDNSWECTYAKNGTACSTGVCDGNGTCGAPTGPIQGSVYDNKRCGCVNGQWNAPRGSLVLIDSGAGSFVKSIVTALGETYTHEMVVQGPGTASMSEYAGPTQVSDCSHPLDASTIAHGWPGMVKINVGGIYGDIYGGGSISFNGGAGSAAVIWQEGDPTRAAAIAAGLDARPTETGVPLIRPQDTIIIRNGTQSPYSLYQYVNIEGTNQGEGGTSLYNGSVSSTFCSYAYALGGPPMTAYNYGHQETDNAAGALWSKIQNDCGAQISWFNNFYCSFTTNACVNAASMVLNCMASPTSGACGSNDTQTWVNVMSDPSFHAYSISPDRLGGLTRFSSENPRPTTWANDTPHQVVWNAAGTVCGCFE